MSDDTTPPVDGIAADTPDDPDRGESGVSVIAIQEEMERSFLDYAMSVIISRALPDARDGLKPVHRRILWSMYDQGFRPDRVHVKCARVTGDVMARFHPHGDSAIYDALARMAQPFSLRHPLIDFHGNYGSPEDPPAAARYTEARLHQLAMRMLDGIDENTVDFADNYSGEFEEPAVLPARFPNLLVNGSQGIAVGMATSIPPHNLGEVIDAALHLLANPDSTPDDLMVFVKGPDFPTGAAILGRVGMTEAYRTGRGSVRLRATAEIEEIGNDTVIVVSELPYQVAASSVAARIKELVNSRELEGIRDVNDASSGDTTRFLVTLKRDANANVVLNNLYKYTSLQTSFPMNMVALVDGVPRTLNLRDLLVAYIRHQVEVVTRRSEYRLGKARDRMHIVAGLIKALDLIDQIIALIRASENRAAAREALMAAPFDFSEIQAGHILDMQLGRLTRLGRGELEGEMATLRATVEELEAILGDEVKLRAVIHEEMSAIRAEFATDRRSRLVMDPGEFDIEDLIEDEELVFVMSAGGYVKTVSADEFRTQGRGGRGVAGASLKDEDFISQLIHTSAHAYLLFFSNRGRVYRLKAHEIPMSSRTARGTAVVNLLPLQAEESIQAIIDTRDYETNRFLFFATRRGLVKKTQFTAYNSSLKAGLIAIKLRDGDELVEVVPTNGNDDIFLTSRSGQTLRFAETDVRAMGRDASGVTGMRFRGADELVSCAVGRDDATLLHVTTAGYGKRTEVAQYPRKGRGGLGVRGIRVTEGRGGVVAAFFAGPDDEVFIIGDDGTIIRTATGDISLQGRDATGVRIMNLRDGSQVAAAAPVLQAEARPDDADADPDDAVDREDGEAPDDAETLEPDDVATADAEAPTAAESGNGDAEAPTAD